MAFYFNNYCRIDGTIFVADKLLLQLTGTEVLSSSGVQSYLERRAESISKSWVAKRHTGIDKTGTTIYSIEQSLVQQDKIFFI